VKRLKQFVLLSALAAQLLALSLPARSQGLAVGIGALRETKPVRSWHELRQEAVVRQKWDMSCGAAALSTLFTYDLGVPVSESEVVVWILRRTDVVKIQARGGFSLLDLKRFAKFRGYESEGYAQLSLQELQDLKRPVIVATRINSFNHFMVFRGIFSNRVVLVDPSFGNITMPIKRFQEIWMRGIAFIVLPPNAEAPAGLQPKRADLLVADLNSVYRQNIAGSVSRGYSANQVLRTAVEATINPYFNWQPAK